MHKAAGTIPVKRCLQYATRSRKIRHRKKPYKRYTQLLREKRKEFQRRGFKKKKRSGLERFFIISNEIRILFCFCNDFFESVEILDSDFRKHLSVDLDVCFIKKTDKLAV